MKLKRARLKAGISRRRRLKLTRHRIARKLRLKRKRLGSAIRRRKGIRAGKRICNCNKCKRLRKRRHRRRHPVPLTPVEQKPNQTQEHDPAAFQQGYDVAYNEGFNSGFAKGFEDGHQISYKAQ